MDDYESLSHTKWECKHHVVFIRVGTMKARLSQYLRSAGFITDPNAALRDPDTACLSSISRCSDKWESGGRVQIGIGTLEE
jgi:hypothetical protein